MRRATRDLVALLPHLGVGGRAVHDALVGYVAFAHDQALATRDRRATATYRSLDVHIRPIG